MTDETKTPSKAKPPVKAKGPKTRPKTKTPRKKRGAAKSQEPKQATFEKLLAAGRKTDSRLGEVGVWSTEQRSAPLEPGEVPTRIVDRTRIHVPAGLNSRVNARGAKIDQLAASIKSEGLMAPLVVTERDFGSDGKPDVRYALVAGARRLAALDVLEAQRVTVVVRNGSALDALYAQGVENLQREQLKNHEVAELVSDLKNRGRSSAEVSEILGLSRSHVDNMHRIVTQLDPAVYEEWKRWPNAFTVGVALAAKDAATQREVWDRWVEEQGGDPSTANVKKRGKTRKPKAPTEPASQLRQPTDPTSFAQREHEARRLNDHIESGRLPKRGRDFWLGLVWALKWVDDRATQLPDAQRAQLARAEAAAEKAAEVEALGPNASDAALSRNMNRAMRGSK